jgi:formylglycine-generating enzyme required for sulfatase activity
MPLRSAAGSLLAIVILIGFVGLAPTFADEFQECPDCPIMVKLPAGRFLMGTAVADRLTDPRTGKPAVRSRSANTRSP